jgi:hypothetical protein
VLERGFHQEDQYALAYAGSWRSATDRRDSLGAARLGGAGSSVSFAFFGTDLDLVSRRGPDAGLLWVQVDGAAASDQQLPRDAWGRGVADLTAPQEEWQATVPLAHGLAAGEHRVTLTVAAGAVTLDGIVVDNRPGFPMSLLWISVTVLALWGALWRLR